MSLTGCGVVRFIASVLGTEDRMFESYHPDYSIIIYKFKMLSVESKVNVADNSGIRVVKCLKFLKGFSNNSKGTLGNISVVSIFDYRGYKQKSSRKVFLGLVISVKK